MVSLNEIRNAGLNVVVDSMHGAGSGYIAKILEGGSTKVFEIRSEVNPSFPDMIQPEPIDQNLDPLKLKISDANGDVGLATDGDADRLGLVDEKGSYISTLHTFALICQHMLDGLNMKGTLVKSITMSNMINKLGEIYDVPVIDTPVGFKYLGPVMMEEDAIAAGEESGGYAFRGHIPERDGILSALLILDMMVKTGKNPSELLDDLEEKVGNHFYARVDIEFHQDQREVILEALSNFNLPTLSGTTISEIDTRDGYRFVLTNGSWALIRFSGTEPLLRIYAESESLESVESLISACRDVVGIQS
jgi:phosphomannomutase